MYKIKIVPGSVSIDSVRTQPTAKNTKVTRTSKVEQESQKSSSTPADVRKNEFGKGISTSWSNNCKEEILWSSLKCYAYFTLVEPDIQQHDLGDREIFSKKLKMYVETHAF